MYMHKFGVALLNSIALCLPVFGSAQQPAYEATVAYDYWFTSDSVGDHKEITELFARYVADEVALDTLPESQWVALEHMDSHDTDLYQILPGCSWYCGAMYEVACSSELPPQGTRTYSCTNLANFTLEDAWIEDVPGNGEGERISFYLEKDHPRVTEILLVNGYVRTEQLYRDHGRFKQLRMYLDGTFVATLNFSDVYAAQRVVLQHPLVFGKDENILAFEITESYPGARYEQTAISQLYFNGLDVH